MPFFWPKWHFLTPYAPNTHNICPHNIHILSHGEFGGARHLKVTKTAKKSFFGTFWPPTPPHIPKICSHSIPILSQGEFGWVKSPNVVKMAKSDNLGPQKPTRDPEMPFFGQNDTFWPPTPPILIIYVHITFTYYPTVNLGGSGA